MRIIPRRTLQGAGAGLATGLFTGALTDDGGRDSGVGHYLRHALAFGALGAGVGAGAGHLERPGVLARQQAAREEAAKAVRGAAGAEALFGSRTFFPGIGFISNKAPVPTNRRPLNNSDRHVMDVAAGAYRLRQP